MNYSTVNEPPPPTTPNNKQVPTTQSHYKIIDILNSKSGTILTAAMGMAIGFAFKDLINSAVAHILQPGIILLLTMTHLTNYYDFTKFITPEKSVLNVSLFISSLFTFIFTIITMYYISNLISLSFNNNNNN